MNGCFHLYYRHLMSPTWTKYQTRPSLRPYNHNHSQFALPQDITHKELIGKKVKRIYTPMEVINSARWNVPQPMAHNGFIVRGLASATEYAHIKVAAVNGVGPSPWTMDIDLCLTRPAEPPSRPLFLRATGATSRTVNISWIPPLHFGGGGKNDVLYEICYTSTVILKNAVSKATSRTRTRNNVMTTDSLTTYKITGLLGDDKISQISVRAVNIKSKIKSIDSEPIKQVLTDATDDVQGK